LVDRALPAGSAGEITALLRAWAAGDGAARDRLASLVYADLRRVARARLHGPASATLAPSDVVQEAYLRLLRQDARWVNRLHFYAVAAEMIRRVLVDRARARAALKRGRRPLQVDFEEAEATSSREPVDIIDLDRALSELALLDAEQARVVELRYFGGLTFEEIAQLSGSSPSSAKRAWLSARLWLHRRIHSGTTPRNDA
jgi:RNA polymerase sigma factor (TIGR02999 family)